jgi:hypothetical protein
MWESFFSREKNQNSVRRVLLTVRRILLTVRRNLLTVRRNLLTVRRNLLTVRRILLPIRFRFRDSVRRKFKKRQTRRRPSTMAWVVVSKTVKLKVTMNSKQSTHPYAVSFPGRRYIFELVLLFGVPAEHVERIVFVVIVVPDKARSASSCDVSPRPCRVEEAVRFPNLLTAVHRKDSRLEPKCALNR